MPNGFSRRTVIPIIPQTTRRRGITAISTMTKQPCWPRFRESPATWLWQSSLRYARARRACVDAGICWRDRRWKAAPSHISGAAFNTDRYQTYSFDKSKITSVKKRRCQPGKWTPTAHSNLAGWSFPGHLALKIWIPPRMIP